MAAAPRTRQPRLGQFQTGSDFTIVRVTLAGQRQAGVGFDEAWTLALKMARREDRQALQETVGAWRAAYAGLPFYTGTALSMLGDSADEHRDTLPLAVYR